MTYLFYLYCNWEWDERLYLKMLFFWEIKFLEGCEAGNMSTLAGFSCKLLMVQIVTGWLVTSVRSTISNFNKIRSHVLDESLISADRQRAAPIVYCWSVSTNPDESSLHWKPGTILLVLNVRTKLDLIKSMKWLIRGYWCLHVCNVTTSRLGGTIIHCDSVCTNFWFLKTGL